jgi:hypothetical protein
MGNSIPFYELNKNKERYFFEVQSIYASVEDTFQIKNCFYVPYIAGVSQCATVYLTSYHLDSAENLRVHWYLSIRNDKGNRLSTK